MSEGVGGRECPTCEEVFATNGGMKVHHKHVHGESIAFVEVECGWCGDSITIKESILSMVENTFCKDKDCERQWRTERYSGERNPVYDAVAVDCAWCGSPKTVPRHKMELNERFFCHQDCQAEWQRANYNGQDHPNWRGGRGLYDSIRTQIVSEKWEKTASRIRDRDGEMCQLCGETQSDRGRKFPVHHIIPLLAGGTNADDLLMTLCVRCHNKAEKTTRRFAESLFEDWADEELPENRERWVPESGDISTTSQSTPDTFSVAGD